MQATNNNIWQFNKQAHHNSHNWYLAVVHWYIDEYGNLPSKVGPGKDVKLIMDVQIQGHKNNSLRSHTKLPS